MRDLISVIVPVYNTQLYVGRCLETLINQSYNQLEIILVDDGSTDNSRVICEKYQAKDRRIKVVTKENGGASTARNLGIELAQGEYICFVDSDDFVDFNYIKLLYEMCIENNCLCSICGFEGTMNDKVDLINYQQYEQYKLTYIEALSPRDPKWSVESIIPVSKLYHRSLFEGVRFPEGKIHEDEATIYKLIYNAKEVMVTRAMMYHYYNGNESVCRSSFTRKRLDSLEALHGRYLFFLEKEESVLAKHALVDYLDRIIAWYVLCYDFDGDVKKLRQELMSFYNQYFYQVIGQKISTSKCIKYIVFKYYPKLFLKYNRVNGVNCR